MTSKVSLVLRSNVLISHLNSYPLGSRCDQHPDLKHAVLKTHQELRFGPALPVSHSMADSTECRQHRMLTVKEIVYGRTQAEGQGSQELALVQLLMCSVIWAPLWVSVSKICSGEVWARPIHLKLPCAQGPPGNLVEVQVLTWQFWHPSCLNPKILSPRKAALEILHLWGVPE